MEDAENVIRETEEGTLGSNPGAESRLTPALLRQHYHQEKLTQKQIAEMYGTRQVSISRLMKTWDINRLIKSDRVDLPDMTPAQESLLIGSLLGDGSLRATGRHTAAFMEGHSEAQAEYTRWKASLFEPYTSAIFETTKRDGEKVFKGLSFTTRAHRNLRPYYDLFYPEGKKVLPTDLVDRMNPLVLAIWYMDDGSIQKSLYPRIAFGLSALSLQRAEEALRGLGLRPTVHRDSRSENMVSLEFPGQGDRFFALVGPHMAPCMAYKTAREEPPRRRVLREAQRLTGPLVSFHLSQGRTIKDIAGQYGVSVTTAKRRIQKTVVFEEEITGWEHKGEEEKSALVSGIRKHLRSQPFPYPQKVPGEVEAEYRRLCQQQGFVQEGVIMPRSYIGTGICSVFFPNRYKASYRGRKSAFELWQSDPQLERAIRFQLDHGDPIQPGRVLKAVMMRGRTPTVFRPGVAKWVYDTWCPPRGRVWDPCAGYGGRLMGAAASGVTYIGTDVEEETIQGNNDLALVLGVSDRCRVVQACAEEFDPGEIDLVFTSPPYFDIELYSSSEAQSYRRYGKVEQWLSGFLQPVFRTACQRLQPSGCFVLNIADKHGRGGVPLVQKAVEVAEAVGFTLHRRFEMPLPRLNRGATSEPLLVFQKRSAR